MRARRKKHARRRGLAAVELAACLPVLCFIALATVDYGRVFSDQLVLTGLAYNGASYYAANTTATSAQIQSAALASNALSPTPTITSATSQNDSNGTAYVTVTASYTFTTIVNYPGIASSVTLQRTVKMPVSPP